MKISAVNEPYEQTVRDGVVVSDNWQSEKMISRDINDVSVKGGRSIDGV